MKGLITTNKPYFHLINNQKYSLLEESLIKEACDNKIEVIKVKGIYCQDMDSMFETFSNLFSFPKYFGWNWDAFSECMADLRWLEQSGWILVIQDIQDVFKKEESMKVFYKILESVASDWNQGSDYGIVVPPTPFHIVLVADSNKVKKAEEELMNNHIQFERIEPL